VTAGVWDGSTWREDETALSPCCCKSFPWELVRTRDGGALPWDLQLLRSLVSGTVTRALRDVTWRGGSKVPLGSNELFHKECLGPERMEEFLPPFSELS